MEDRRNNYSVGWICVQTEVQDAAVGMLDEVHPTLLQSPHDQNSYVLGRVGRHNVVVGMMPIHTTPPDLMATLPAQMRMTFPGIKAALFLGLGGCAPYAKSHDFRLGDVVISEPSEKSSGVIQIDYSTWSSGCHLVTGVAVQPGALLMDTLNTFKEKHASTPAQFLSHMTSFLDKHPQLRRKYDFEYCRDILFHGNYPHAENSNTQCDLCDMRQTEKRRPRTEHNSVIHYGLIIASDKAMISPGLRDAVAWTYEAICFQKEPVSLLNIFPCLVFRGICNYSDSHRTKLWWGPAALAAAAAAKGFMNCLPEFSDSDSSSMASVRKENLNPDSSKKRKLIGKYIPLDPYVAPTDLALDDHSASSIPTDLEGQLSQLEQNLWGDFKLERIQVEDSDRSGESFMERVLRTVRPAGRHIEIFWVVTTGIDTLQELYFQIARSMKLLNRLGSLADLKKVILQRMNDSRRSAFRVVLQNRGESVLLDFTKSGCYSGRETIEF